MAPLTKSGTKGGASGQPRARWQAGTRCMPGVQSRRTRFRWGWPGEASALVIPKNKVSKLGRFGFFVCFFFVLFLFVFRINELFCINDLHVGGGCP